MCGINGFIQFQCHNIAFRDKAKQIVSRMNESIKHRGPDDEGLFCDERCALGMRRLSIIDLDTGNQPIWNEDKTKLIVFNGEIYNYRILRKDLIGRGHCFSTQSDTEVVLHGFEEYGIHDLLNKLEGMFAFAIYDIADARWFLARDRIGEKPLYFSKNDSWMLFASELKSISSTGLVSKAIDQAAMSQFFQLTYIPAPKTIFQDVLKLPAGSYMIVNANGIIQEKAYWEPCFDRKEQEPLSYAEYQKKLREELTRSVSQRMISDVPLGAFLSGGFDSSIIVGLMSQLSDQPVNTFTVGFEGKVYDESKLAALVAKKHRTNHEVFRLSEDEMLADLEGLLQNIDEPFADSSLIAVHAISKAARKHVKVVLTGDGGDELFAGYNKYLLPYYGSIYRKIPGLFRKHLAEPLLNLMPSKSYRTQAIRKVLSAFDLSGAEQCRFMMSLGFKERELITLMPRNVVDPLAFIQQEYDHFQTIDAQTRTQYVDIKTVLEGDMLPKVDRASMLASLETRVPMLDSRVVELAFSIPTEFKIKGRNRKIILKDTFRDLLPEELFHAAKHGFGVPVSDWLETSLRDELMRYASEELLESQGIFSHEFISHTITQHMTHQRDRFSELWSFFVFQNWYERTVGF